MKTVSPAGDNWLSEFVRARMAAKAAADAAARAWLDEAQGITLYATIGHEAILRPDGTVWLFHDDNNLVGPWKWRPASVRERMGARVIASERIPELGERSRIDQRAQRTALGAVELVESLNP